MGAAEPSGPCLRVVAHKGLGNNHFVWLEGGGLFSLDVDQVGLEVGPFWWSARVLSLLL